MSSKFHICFLVALLSCQLWPTRNNALVDLPIDIVVVIFGESFGYPASLQGLKDTMFNLSNYFQMGEDKMRVAILDCIMYGGCAVSVTYTGDNTLFTKVLNSTMRNIGSERFLFVPFKMVREQLLTSRTTAVIMLYASWDPIENVTEVKKEAAMLRQNGTLIYAVFDKAPLVDSENWAHFVEITGSDERAFLVSNYLGTGFRHDGNFTTAIFEKIKHDVDKHFCTYDGICAYEDASRQTCVRLWWNPKVEEAWGDCSKIVVPPALNPNVTCDASDCANVCDSMWPWSGECTNDNRGISLKRNGIRPRRKFLEYCPETMQCPPRPQTTTTYTIPTPATSGHATNVTSLQPSTVTQPLEDAATANMRKTAFVVLGMLVAVSVGCAIVAFVAYMKTQAHFAEFEKQRQKWLAEAKLLEGCEM